MGVITADRISSSGQKVAARMQGGRRECSEPCQTELGMAQAPAVPTRLQHHHTSAAGTGQRLAQHPRATSAEMRWMWQTVTVTLHFSHATTAEAVTQDSLQWPARAYGRNSPELLSIGYILPQEGQEKVPCAFHSITAGMQPF